MRGGRTYTQQKKEPAAAPGPPFVPTSANNGLSVDPITGRIVLGQSLGEPGDPSQLLDAREIVMAGHPFTMRNGNFTQFRIDPGLELYQIGDIDDAAAGNYLGIDNANQVWFIGQRTPVTNLLMNNPAAGIGLSFFDSLGTNPFLLPDPGIGGIAFISAPDFTTQLSLADASSGSAAIMGDVGNINNQTKLTVDDAGQKFTVDSGGINIATLNQALKYNEFRVDDFVLVKMRNGGGNRDVVIGDVGNVGNGMSLNVDDIARTITAMDGTFGPGMVLNFNTGDFFIGDWNNSNNGTFIDVYDNSLGVSPYIFMSVGNPPVGTFTIDSSIPEITMTDGNFSYFSLNFSAQKYRIGNAAVGSGNFFELDDVAGVLNIDNIAHNMGIQINGATGFTGTVTPVTSITVNNGIVTAVT